MKWQKIISLVFVFAFLMTSTVAQAADFRVGAKTNGSVNIGEEESITSLYTAGNIITVDADVEKGVHAAGNVINLNGNVGHSVYSAGGTLMISGNVGGSVHGAGGQIVIESNVTDDLIIAGGNVMVSDKATIGGDLVMGAGTLDLQGSVAGDVYLAGGAVVINGVVGGNVDVKEAEDLTIGSNAVINGDLTYFSKKEIVIEEGAVINGETVLAEKGISGETDIDKGILAGALFALFSILWLIKLLGLLIVGLVAIYLFRRLSKGTVNMALSNFWRSLGIGIAALILTPIVAIMIMATVVGFWLGMLIMMTYVIMLFTASVLTGVTAGSWLAWLIKKGNNYPMDWKTVVIGTLAIMVLGIIPFIGWFLALVLILINLGALYSLALGARK